MRVSSPPVTGPCYYGIDTPSREELIAANIHRRGDRRAPRRRQLGYLSLDGMLESVPVGPARILPRLLLRRLSDTAADRPRQAAVRLRLLTAEPARACPIATVRNHDRRSTSSATARAEGTKDMKSGPRRQGREPRRDDEPRRARSAGLHDRVRAVHRVSPRRSTSRMRLRDEVDAALERLERATGKRFGDATNPLLVSVRSGAPVSMPGMMETILNLGLNDDTVGGLARRERQPALRLRLVSALHPDVRRRRARRAVDEVRASALGQAHDGRRRDRCRSSTSRCAAQLWSRSTRRSCDTAPARSSRWTRRRSCGVRSRQCGDRGRSRRPSTIER